MTLVVWTVNEANSADVYAARVDTLGNVLDPAGIPIVTVAFEQGTPAVASDGAGWFVVWTDRRDGASPDIFGARVSANGAVVESQGFAISRDPRDEGRPAVAYDGTNFFVAWSAGRDVRGARVDTGGHVLDSDTILVATRQADGSSSPPRVAVGFDGTNWVAVWDDRRTETGSSMDVLATRVNAAGDVIDQFVVAGTTADESNPAIDCEGAACLVAWDEANGISAVRTSSGAVLDASHLRVVAQGAWSSIAHDGTNWLVAGLNYVGPSLRVTRVS
ncbi:MAG TPA: hypothetical protein VLJ38_21550, partial [Polyangiaceae bacterium]|nr:hypothetical protein [Polyangiaceae bacterium]